MEPLDALVCCDFWSLYHWDFVEQLCPVVNVIEGPPGDADVRYAREAGLESEPMSCKISPLFGRMA